MLQTTIPYLTLVMVLIGSSLTATADEFDWYTWSTQEFTVTKVNEQTLKIQGDITQGAYQAFKSSFNTKIKTVHVSSPGGNVAEAVKIGLDLMKNGVDVVVDGPCLSSCANYFFLAGKHKFFGENGFVGFHGSPWHGARLYYGVAATDEFIDQGKLSTKMQEDLKSKLSGKPKGEVAKNIHSFRTTLKDNRDFFKQVRASDRLVENSVDGRFAATLPECHSLYPLTKNEKNNEPFQFLTNKQMSAYGAKNISGDQNWTLAYQSSFLISHNLRDNGSPIFCVDAYDAADWQDMAAKVAPAFVPTTKRLPQGPTPTETSK